MIKKDLLEILTDYSVSFMIVLLMTPETLYSLL